MLDSLTSTVILLAGLAWVPPHRPQDGPSDDVGKAAPAFVAMASDGKQRTLKELADGNVLVLAFVKDGCKLSPTAMVYFNRLGTAFQGRKHVQFFGVLDDDPSGFGQWAKLFHPTFDFLLDPERQIVKAYHVERSCEVVVVESGKVARHFKGLSRDGLTQVVTVMSQAVGIAPESAVDIADSPEVERFG